MVAHNPLGPFEPAVEAAAHVPSDGSSGSGSGRVGGGENGDGQGGVQAHVLRYDDARAGRLRLRDVTVANAGIDWTNPANVYWQASLSPPVPRLQATRVCSKPLAPPLAPPLALLKESLGHATSERSWWEGRERASG